MARRIIASLLIASCLFALCGCSFFEFAPNSNTVTSDSTNPGTALPDTPYLPYPPVKAYAVPEIYITYDENETLSRSEYITATIHVKDVNGNYSDICDTLGSIRIRGNSTSSGAKLPFNIKFSKKIDLLGMGKAKKWCLLANLYDKTLMRNKLAYDFARKIGLSSTSNAQFADLYLNGEYVGNYLLCESVGIGSDRVDITPEKNEFLLEYEPWPGYSNPISVTTSTYGITLGLDDTDAVTDVQMEYLTDFLNSFEAAIKSKDFNEICKYMDVESFVDFYIVNELFKNVDFSTSSTRFTIKGGKIYAGPVWDLDLSSGNCSTYYYEAYNNTETNNDSSTALWCNRFWYRDLYNNEGFYEALCKRYKELQPVIINLTTDNEMGTNRIDALYQTYCESFLKNYDGLWSVSIPYSPYEWQSPADTYMGNVELLRSWLISRNSNLYGEWCAD